MKGLGRRPWQEVRAALVDMECAWADLTGFHIGPVPEEAPAYSHLWAWSEGLWARVRVDDQEGIVGLLRPVVTEGEVAKGEIVEVEVHEARTWRAREDQRVSALAEEVSARTATLLVTCEPNPVTFISLSSV